MKLFKVMVDKPWSVDYDLVSVSLIVAESLEKANEIALERLKEEYEEDYVDYSLDVVEILSVDGYKIELSEIN